MQVYRASKTCCYSFSEEAFESHFFDHMLFGIEMCRLCNTLLHGSLPPRKAYTKNIECTKVESELGTSFEVKLFQKFKDLFVM